MNREKVRRMIREMLLEDNDLRWRVNELVDKRVSHAEDYASRIHEEQRHATRKRSIRELTEALQVVKDQAARQQLETALVKLLCEDPPDAGIGGDAMGTR